MALVKTHDDHSVRKMADFVAGVPFTEVMALEEIEPDLFRANFVYDDAYRLYGGQVAAQALLAAGRTVDPDRQPHSLHGYFLRSGQCELPTVFEVHRDRDGRSYSARRVVARQGGKAIFTSVMSFAVADDGADNQVLDMPVVPAPQDCEQIPVPRLFAHEWGLLEPLTAELPFPTGSGPGARRTWATIYCCTPPPSRTCRTGQVAWDDSTTARMKQARASTMRSGSTNPCAPMRGCSMR